MLSNYEANGLPLGGGWLVLLGHRLRAHAAAEWGEYKVRE
jgi:hypothetical protein